MSEAKTKVTLKLAEIRALIVAGNRYAYQMETDGSQPALRPSERAMILSEAKFATEAVGRLKMAAARHEKHVMRQIKNGRYEAEAQASHNT